MVHCNLTSLLDIVIGLSFSSRCCPKRVLDLQTPAQNRFSNHNIVPSLPSAGYCGRISLNPWPGGKDIISITLVSSTAVIHHLQMLPFYIYIQNIYFQFNSGVHKLNGFPQKNCNDLVLLSHAGRHFLEHTSKCCCKSLKVAPILTTQVWPCATPGL